MNDNKAFAAGLKHSMKRPEIALVTLAQNVICLEDRAAMEAAASKNGMSVKQLAAAKYVQSIAGKLPAEALSILRDKALALIALDRVAALVMGEDLNALPARIAAAILNK